jgi:N-acetylmuramoyl-L-alanine amidase
VFCGGTAAALGAFQAARGLRATGVCDEPTWAALVEASWELGDRLLYHRSPNLRGDDVADLQRRLGRLGFDAGRVDGIFGPLTVRALEEFQRNVGLMADGICGYETIRALHRLGPRTGDGPGVAAVRELERLRRAPRTLSGRRIVVGQLGGLATLVRGLGRGLRAAGANVVTVDDPDGSVHAQTANHFGADLYLGLTPAEAEPTIAYYAVAGFESVGGRRLASLIHQRLRAIEGAATAEPLGMRLPVLRETRMPAVLCELGPIETIVPRAPLVTAGLCHAVGEWVEAPLT